MKIDYDKWVADLRSGEFKQAQEALTGYVWDEEADVSTEERGYCCLGVLACTQFPVEVAPKFGWDGTEFTGLPVSEMLEAQALLGEYMSVTCLPQALVDDLDNASDHALGELMSWNDSGHSFQQIADFIERWVDPESGELRAGFPLWSNVPNAVPAPSPDLV